VLFASLVDDPSSSPDHFPTLKAQEAERRRLFDIIERLVQWENTTNEAVLEEARVEIRRSTGNNPPRVLDPFCGGGSIPLEAQRLGLEAYGSDLNPVAVLITKALVEIPPRFSNCLPVHPDARGGMGASGTWSGAAGLSADVRQYGAWMREEAERRIGHLYPKIRLPKEQGGGEAIIIAWLWARTVRCANPACGATTPLLTSFVLSSKAGQESYVVPSVRGREIGFEVGPRPPAWSTNPKKGYKRGVSGIFECAVCGSVTTRDHVAKEGVAGRIGEVLTAVVAEGPHGRTYVSPDLRTVPPHMPEPDTSDLVAELALNPRDVWCRNFGLKTPRDLFTRRQLVALTTFSDLVAEARQRVLNDALAAGVPAGLRFEKGGVGALAYADAVATYLAFGVDKMADTNSTLCTWQMDPPRLRATFGRQALPMTWDFAEAGVFGDAAGDYQRCIGSLAEVLDRWVPGPSGVAQQKDAVAPSSLDRCAVSTDPPYYDNIGYADLSDFFYVWLRRSLADIYPELFGTVLTPKAAELVATPYRYDGDRGKADQHFEHGLGAAFRRMHDVSDIDVPLTVYYAFKQAETEDEGDGGSAGTVSTGWETMLEGLLSADLSIDGTWPMRSELATRNVGRGTNALASSIVLVCRPRSSEAGITTRKDLVACLKRELPEALRTLQHGNIAPVDLAQAAIGPGMAVFSRFANVLEPDGSRMRVRTALAIINQALDEVLAEQEGDFDADTRWAVAWYEQFGLDAADSGRAILLSQAKNTSLDGLQAAGIVEAVRGKTRLLSRSEYSTDWDPAKDTRLPAWEATQRLVHALLDAGEGAAAEMQAKLGGLGEQARDLAYRLYQVAERKGWTDEARAYNALVVAWPDLLRGAERVRAAEPSQPSLGLE